MKSISKMVITGGPCAGKTTAMSWIESNFTSKGYLVLFINETATDLILGGIKPWVSENIAFQTALLTLQKTKERVFEDYAKTASAEKVLIVCDRGALDNKIYMSSDEFQAVMNIIGVSEIELRDGYDAIFHLVTAAKGAEEYYTLSNNKARRESVEEATALDDRLIGAWTGHPHLRVIDNSSDFENKMSRLIAEMSSFLGEPEPWEIERKFLIQYPDIARLEKLENCEKIEIIQTYLCSSDPTEEVRVRQRGKAGHYIYTQTTKKRVTDTKRIEIEKRLTQSEYLSLLMNADTSLKQIRKNRYCLTFCNQYFEIDIYPFWKDKAIMEIELRDDAQKIMFPDFVDVLCEVTGDSNYQNYSLAKGVIG